MKPRFSKGHCSAHALALCLMLALPDRGACQAGPPTPVELMFGNHRVNLQMSTNKPLGGSERFGFANVTVTAADYRNTAAETDMIMNNSLTYRLAGSLQATTGILFHYRLGLVPTIGLRYQKAGPGYMVMIFPMYDFLPQPTSETIAIVELKPSLGGEWRLYTRAQALFIYNLRSKEHARSAVVLREGISRGRLSFGIGQNWDYYGPGRILKPNFGAFVQTRL